MTNHTTTILSALVLTGLAIAPAIAAPVVYNGTLAGGSEVPPVNSAGTGTVTITYDPITHAMTHNVNFSGLLGTVAAAHIHCCTAGPGSSAGVATQTPTLPGFPTAVNAGTYTNTFDMSLASSYNTSFVTSQGSVTQAEAALTDGMGRGGAYFNVHSTSFAGGEIRADLFEKPVFANGFDSVAQPLCGWNTALGTPGGSLNTIGRWNNELYFGGNFGGVSAGVGRIDLGTNAISSLGTTETTDGFLGSFVPYNAGSGERLYVIGTFNGVRFGGVELPDSRGVVAWDGTTTTTLPGSPFAQPLHFAQTGTVWNNQLVIAGAAGVSPQLALLTLWNGTTWTTYRDEFEGQVAPVIFAAESFGGNLYFAGRFDRIRLPDGNGGTVVTESRNLMGFNGTSFFSVGGGVIRLGSAQGFGMSLKTFNDGSGDALYIGGSFNRSADGTVTLPGVARWNGSSLTQVGQGFPITQVRSLEVYNDGSGPALFAAGTFTADNNTAPIRRLAKLVGDTWIEVAGGTGSNPSRLIVLPDGRLAVGGSFTEVGAVGTVPGSGPSSGLAMMTCTPNP
ncbi:MAG: CHRD domain-containing protein [Dokdonella sp.]